MLGWIRIRKYTVKYEYTCTEYITVRTRKIFKYKNNVWTFQKILSDNKSYFLCYCKEWLSRDFCPIYVNQSHISMYVYSIRYCISRRSTDIVYIISMWIYCLIKALYWVIHNIYYCIYKITAHNLSFQRMSLFYTVYLKIAKVPYCMYV